MTIAGKIKLATDRGLTVVEIRECNGKLTSITHWLRERYLVHNQGYFYLGSEQEVDYFAFPDKQDAMLFKLTFA